jgi:agmatinase
MERPDDTMWQSVLHAGLAGTFGRLPHVPADTERLREAGARAAILGLPWDSTSIARTGANYGPRAIREISAQSLVYNAKLDIDLRDVLAPVDCGDIATVLANAERTFAQAESDIGAVLDAGALPVVLGGDHSTTIPAVRAVRKRFEQPGLVLLDSHFDTAEDVGGEKLNHCCPIARAVDAGFPPDRMVLIGINGWLNPRPEREYCERHGIRVIWLDEIWEHGVDWALSEALAVAGQGTDGIYLSVDIDALDGGYAPGTSVPTPGGMTSREALLLVRGIARAGLVGLDVVEVAPSLDPTPATAGLAARIVLDALVYHSLSTVASADTPS